MPQILIVDDNDDNRAVLRDALEDQGYGFAEARDGVEALASVMDRPPDLVLLDVMMPEMDGIECCRRLKSDETTKHIPVILITALSDEHHVLRGLSAGAQDYIAKPFAGPVVRARIETALRGKLATDELRQRNLEIRDLVRVLAQKNTKLEQLTTTAHRFVDNVAHEFRTPLAVLKEFASILMDGLGGPVTDTQVEYLQFIDRATVDLSQMVDDFLDSSKLKAGTLRVDRRRVEVGDIIDRVLPLLKARAAERRITVRRVTAEGLGPVFVDAEKAQRVIINLAVNAIKFSPEESEIEIRAESDAGGGARIVVSDRGPGLSSDELNLAFKRFGQTADGQQSASKGFGLGLNIARELVGLNLGTLDVQSAPGHGSAFSFTLPPCDIDGLLERYLAEVRGLAEPPVRIAAIEAVPNLAGAPVEPIRRRLVAVCYPMDLVLPRRDEASIVLVGCTTEVDAWISRLMVGTSGRDDGGIEFTLRPLGSWPLDAAEAINACFATPALPEPARA